MVLLIERYDELVELVNNLTRLTAEYYTIKYTPEDTQASAMEIDDQQSWEMVLDHVLTSEENSKDEIRIVVTVTPKSDKLAKAYFDFEYKRIYTASDEEAEA
jgi:hypothetical protein